MTFKKYILLLLLIPVLFSCENFFNRYDPVEAAGLVFGLEEFYFYRYSGSNSTYLYSDYAYGDIDMNSRMIKVIVPPSLDLTATSLTADLYIKNIGLEEGYETWPQDTRNWYTNPKIKLTKNYVGYTGDEDTYFDPEYEVKLKKQLLVDLALTSADSMNDIYPYNYIYTPSPQVTLNFNDLVYISELSNSDFTSNYTLSAINSANAIDPEFQFYLASAGLSEGTYYLSLNEGSCEASTPGYFNEATELYTFAYDASAPTMGISALDLSSSNFSPSSVDGTVLKISFDSATDTLTPDSDLEYKLCFSSSAVTDVQTASDMYYDYYSTYIPVDGQEWFTYSSPLSFTYYELPYSFRASLVTGQAFYINIIVRDNCTDAYNRTTAYTAASITYTGP